MGWNWKERYGDRLVSPEEAAKVVKSGDRVTFAMASPLNTPVAMAQALAKRAPELRDVSIDVTFSAAAALGLLAPGTEESWTATTLFAITETEMSALSAHSPQVDFVPMNPSFMGFHADQPGREDFTRRYTSSDVFVVTVTPPNQAGFVTFGANLWNSRDQARHAKVIIGEVNDQLPVVPGGDNWMPADAFDYFVETRPVEIPPVLRDVPEEEVEPTQVCGYYTAELINNGDTVMFGGGAMPTRLGAFLEDKEDLGCHTEVVCPISLVQKGVINGKKRNLAPGKVSLTGIIAQNEEEWAWLDGNPKFELRDMAVNNHPKYIAQNDNLVAVNAPLEITLWGEINVERVGPRYFRGVGGQLEFIIGALLSKGGRSIHAVLSRKKGANGEWFSTIVPEFTKPGVATVPRQLTDIVVTEWGVARLMGKTERERAEELIAVAHPDFRAELREAAKRAFGIGRRTLAAGA